MDSQNPKRVQSITPKDTDDPNMGDDTPRIVPVKKPRLTVVSNVYHQIPGEEVAGPPPSRFYRWLEGDDQAYSRSVKVRDKWQSLDLGWLDKVNGYSIVTIANGTKRLPSRKPTPAEEAEFYSRVLEVGLLERDGEVTPIAYIPVGEDMRLPPLNLDKFRIRSRTVETKYLIFLLPM